MAKQNFTQIKVTNKGYWVNNKIVQDYKSPLLTPTEARCLEQFQKSGIRLLSSTYWTP